jgi:hypothetical protein
VSVARRVIVYRPAGRWSGVSSKLMSVASRSGGSISGVTDRVGCHHGVDLDYGPCAEETAHLTGQVRGRY